MEQILIAVDEDPLAEKVIRQGVMLAQKVSAKATVCHVMPEEHYRRIEEQQLREEQSFSVTQAEAQAEVVVEEAVQALGTLEMDLDKIGAVGEPAETIVELARELDADLIVMGFEGLRGIERLRALGSVSRAVMEKTKRPVLIVPAVKEREDVA